MQTEATMSALASSRGFPESSVSSKASSDFLSLICTQQQTFQENYCQIKQPWQLTERKQSDVFLMITDVHFCQLFLLSYTG
jgi:hypothetical protein